MLSDNEADGRICPLSLKQSASVHLHNHLILDMLSVCQLVTKYELPINFIINYYYYWVLNNSLKPKWVGLFEFDELLMKTHLKARIATGSHSLAVMLLLAPNKLGNMEHKIQHGGLPTEEVKSLLL